MAATTYTRDEIAARGEAIYREKIRENLSASDQGKHLVIDIERGSYEIDEDDVAATKRALARSPSAVLYGLRAGFPAAYRLKRSACGATAATMRG